MKTKKPISIIELKGSSLNIINGKIKKCQSNRLIGKYPYSKENGLYIRVLGLNYNKIYYLTHQQAKEANNLIKAKKLIDIEIKNILKGASINPIKKNKK